MKMKSNLLPGELKDLNWTTDQLGPALDSLRQYADTNASNAINWYFSKKEIWKRGAQIHRIAAILLVAYAGCLPILNRIFADNPPTSAILTIFGQLDTLWCAILVAIASTLLLIDRFFGFSSGWVRYVQTAQRISMEQESFRMSMERRRLEWCGETPPLEDARETFALIESFNARIRQIVAEETNTWAVEFSKVVSEIDDKVKEAGEKLRRGGILLIIENGEQCEGEWNVHINNGITEKRTGNSIALLLSSGLHKLVAQGTINSKSVRAEAVVQIRADEIQEARLTLK